MEAIPSRVFMNGNIRTADGDLLIHPCPTQRGQALLKTLAGFDPDFVASLQAQQSQKLPRQERELL